MLILIAGLVLFFSVHSVSIVNDPWRNRVAARLGERAWMGLYALLSIAGFVLIVWGYGLARQEPVVIYTPPAWLRHPAHSWHLRHLLGKNTAADYRHALAQNAALRRARRKKR